MATIYMADISEFQSNIDAPTYLKNHKNIICRVHNGYRADHMMPGRRDYLRKYKFAGIGWYQYLAPDRDPAQQAQDFIHTVGSLRVNEWAICDCEQGSGNQQSRVHAWMNVVAKWANMNPMLYSGESYLSTNLGGPGAWKGYPIWVAAYRNSEPTGAHMLWQYSDKANWSAITPHAADGSLHHGTENQFIYDVRHAKSG